MAALLGGGYYLLALFVYHLPGPSPLVNPTNGG